MVIYLEFIIQYFAVELNSVLFLASLLSAIHKNIFGRYQWNKKLPIVNINYLGLEYFSKPYLPIVL